MSKNKTKKSVIVVFTGEGKGKTSASLGMTIRALGAGQRVAYIQFIKHWDVSEHNFLREIRDIYKDELYFFKGGRGFYNAGDMSAAGVSQTDHQLAARETLEKAVELSQNGEWDLVVCDEINNAIHDGLLSLDAVKSLMNSHHQKTSLCLTGRDFPPELDKLADIVSDIQKRKHHYDDGFVANKGIDF